MARDLKYKRLNTKLGYTMLELMLTIAIIIFIFVALVTFYPLQLRKSHDAKRKTDLRYVQNALEEFEKDKGYYPKSLKKGAFLAYLPITPLDPTTKKRYRYQREKGANSSWYWLFTQLENKGDPDIAKVGCTAPCGPNPGYNYYVGSPNSPQPSPGKGEDEEE